MFEYFTIKNKYRKVEMDAEAINSSNLQLNFCNRNFLKEICYDDRSARDDRVATIHNHVKAHLD